jgi:hypothetical protein
MWRPWTGLRLRTRTKRRLRQRLPPLIDWRLSRFYIHDFNDKNKKLFNLSTIAFL